MFHCMHWLGFTPHTNPCLSHSYNTGKCDPIVDGNTCIVVNGGAAQWGVKTVLGVPIPSPNVGRIVMLLYSRNDRTREPEMVRRITEELTKVRRCLYLFICISPSIYTTNIYHLTE